MVNRGSGASDHAAILPIWFGKQCLPVRARLISGRTELLVGVAIAGELNITVCFCKLEFHIGNGEWEVVTCNKKNNWVSPPSPTARGYAKLGEYFRNEILRIRSFGGAR